MIRQQITFFKIVILFFTLAITFLPALYSQEDPESEDFMLLSAGESGEPYILDNLQSGSQVYITDPEILKQLERYSYLLIDLYSEKERSAIVRIEFSARPEAETQGGIQATIGMMPGIRTNLVLPLKGLGADGNSLPRFPGQLKGVISGRRLAPEDVGKITIYSIAGKSGSKSAPLKIFRIILTNNPAKVTTESDLQYVDSLGQWIQKDWKGKIGDLSAFESHAEYLSEISSDSIGYPESWSAYGGWKKLRFDSTGFFRIHFDGIRWWLVDPDGYAFLSHGMDCVTNYAPGTYSGNEKIFIEVPVEPLVRSEVFLTTGEDRMIDFFRWNMFRVFGSDWRANWNRVTRNKLISAGFNTIGNWSDHSFTQSARIPYVLPMNGFPQTEINVYRDFPDVFSPEYRQKAAIFAAQLAPYREDPFLIGYFLRNEPKWAMGNNNPAFEMFRVNDPSFTKNEFVRWIMKRYPEIDSLNSAWETNFSFFTDLFDLSLKDYPSQNSREDFLEFSRIMVREYLRVISLETRKQAPDHLNLGMRYAYISSDLLYEAADLFDVFSVNGYNYPGPPDTKEIFERTGKPVLIGEFHFGALDRGLPSTGLVGVKNQRQRGKAYRYYVEQGFSRPEIIGIHYFQWMDQPVFGRFDGENYNIGFNDILYQPYKDLYDASRETGMRIYGIAAGEAKPFRRKAKRVPAVSF